MARALAEAGRPEQAEQVARAISDPSRRADALTAVVRALARVGLHGQAGAVAEQAERTAHAISDPSRRASALIAVARGLAEAGRLEQAEQVARAISDPTRRASGLIAVIRALVEVGLRGRVGAVAERAEQAALAISDLDGLSIPSERGDVLYAA